MCCFTVLGGVRGGPKNQSVSGVTTICLTQCNTSPSHRVDQVVDCGLCWSTPLQCLCEVAGYWQELEHAVVYADPEPLKHAQWVTCPVSMLAMQELGCFQLPGIVFRSLQHGAYALSCCNMRWWSWMKGTTMGLRISSRYLCAFKMPSIKCTCDRFFFHNTTPAHTITPPPPWATRSTTLTSANCSPTRRHTRCLPSVLYSENRGLSVKRTPLQECQMPSNMSICPLKSITMKNSSQVETPMRTTSMQMSFPETVSDSLCRNSLVM